MPFDLKLASELTSSSMVVGGVALPSVFMLNHSALPRWTLTGIDHTSPLELTMSFRSFGMALSSPSSFQMPVMGSILPALTP